jgi:hypothetical protein
LSYSFKKDQRVSETELNEVVFRFDCPVHGFTERKGQSLSKIEEQETPG